MYRCNLSAFCLIFLMCMMASVILGYPTEYKMNKKKIYEAELVPVSSTVIPLSIYEVSSSDLKFPQGSGHIKEDKHMKPVGPLTLITSANKKAHFQKFVSDDISTVKKSS